MSTSNQTASNQEDRLICVACGTEFDQPADVPLEGCVICDDPRQYVPPAGQAWTSLAQLFSSGKYTNEFEKIDSNDSLWSITTAPKFGIGQRAILICTPEGNVLWDCITYLDQATIDFVKGKGGLEAIVISHPHYYTTHLRWAEVFECPVFISAEDESWVQRTDGGKVRRLIKGETEEIVPGITAIKIGGHFPGSLVLHWENQKRLFIADSFVTVPSALYHKNRPKGTTSYSFMWSIPNMIPLPPAEMMKMWRVLKGWEFSSTHGAFAGLEVRDSDGGGGVKGRVLESMKIQARGEGWGEDQAEIFGEVWEG